MPRIALTSGLIALVAILAAGAPAAPAAKPKLRVALVPNVAQPGETVAVRVRGARKRAVVRVRVQKRLLRMGGRRQRRTSRSGRIRARFRVPRGIAPGRYRVEIRIGKRVVKRRLTVRGAQPGGLGGGLAAPAPGPGAPGASGSPPATPPGETALPPSACTPGPPAYDPAVPTWESVNTIPLGSRQASAAELDRYVRAVDEASDRVRSTALPVKSWQGREMVYAFVARPESLSPGRLEELASRARALRATGPSEAEAAARTDLDPAFAAVFGSVHGLEPSGADATAKLLYELAARTDCANTQRLDELVSILMPLQNPDGREGVRRENAYGFDLNRDWFAATQPETAAKIELLRQYPPLTFIDAHEQAGTAYFFPPNSDPIHHEVSGAALSQINDVLGRVTEDAFEANGYDYNHYDAYDLFFPGFGDTTPTIALGSAGITLEKGGQSPYPEKVAEHFTAEDAMLSVTAQRKDALYAAWAGSFREALDQGRRGQLEPNLVQEPGNELMVQVPADPVAGYAIRADRHAGDAAKLVDRLRSLDVEVQRLAKPARVQLDAFGAAGLGEEELPAGTLWVPFAQAQKHWVQTLLGEEPFAAVNYFYDVAAWSNPLLMGLGGGTARTAPPAGALEPLPAADDGGGAPPAEQAPGGYAFATDSSRGLALALALLRAGETVSRLPGPLDGLGTGAAVLGAGADRARLDGLARRFKVPVAGLAAAPAGAVELRSPRVALLVDAATDAYQLEGTPARYVIEHVLGADVVTLGQAQVEAGGLLTGGYDAAVVAPAFADVGVSPFTPAALAQLKLFVEGGGTFLGSGRTGLGVARAAGVTAVQEQGETPDFELPGNLLAAQIAGATPLTWGMGADDVVFNGGGDPVLDPATAGEATAARYPAGDGFFVSGYTTGAREALAGTPVATLERIGDGQVALTAFDPYFRGYVEAGHRWVANALLLPPAAGGEGAPAGPVRAALQRPDLPARMARVRVRPADAGALAAAAAAVDLPAGADLDGPILRVPATHDRPAHPPAWVDSLLDRLRARGVRPVVVIA